LLEILYPMTTTPFIYQLLNRPMTGPEIESRSFEIIDSEALDRKGFSLSQWEVVRRMIHTTGDAELAASVKFSSDALESGIAALKRGVSIYVDSNMIRSGLSLARLRSVHEGYEPDRIACHVADADVAREALSEGLPRSLFAIRKAKPRLDGGIVVFGNAPVALLELNRMIMEEGIRPALVIGMPVGFVHVVESKEELATLGVPFIAIEGRRGGSTLAVAALHAICTLATRA
jgi:precorrin-8X/cobalt-precorrin-8 methylmutase